jgi:beta-lactamase regulating signal transducer with metallopeptidase domain
MRIAELGASGFLGGTWVLFVGWALLHSLWQAALLAALAAGLLALLRAASANLRYVLACATLALMFAAPIATVTLCPPRDWAGHSAARDAIMPAIAGSGTGAAAADEHTRAGLSAARPFPADARSLAPGTEKSAADGGRAERPADNPALLRGGRLSGWFANWLAVANSLADAATRLEPVLPAIVVIWLVGVLLLSTRLTGEAFAACALRRHSTPPAAAASWQRLLRDLGGRMRLGGVVHLLESPRIDSPMVIGWLRPVILLPAAALSGLMPRQLEAVLAHELAHIRRWDYLANFLQRVVETLLFYHPAVWWVSRRIRQERENCCDDLAAAAVGDAGVLVGALLALEQQRAASAPSLAVAARGGSFVTRIRRLLGVDTRRHSPTAAAAGVAIISTFAFLTIGFALQSAPPVVAGQNAGSGPQVTYAPIPTERGPTNSITLRVVDEAGQPVADVSVLAAQLAEARAQVWEGKRPPNQRRASTNADGVATIAALDADLWAFHVDPSDERFARQWPFEASVEVPCDRLDLPLELRVHAPRRLNGRVIDEAGQPVPKARVIFMREFLPERDDWLQGNNSLDLHVTTADDEGRFALERLRPGKIMLQLEAPDHAHTPQTIDVEPTDVEKRVTLGGGLALHGRVRHAGRPLPHVTLQVNAIKLSHRSMGQWRPETDTEGRFVVEHIYGFGPDVLNHATPQHSPTAVTVSIDDPNWHSAYYNVCQLDVSTLPDVEIEALPKSEPLPQEALRVGGVARTPPTDPAALGNSTILVRVEGTPDRTAGAPHVSLYRIFPSEPPVYQSISLDDSPAPRFEQLPPGEYGLFVTDQQRGTRPIYPLRQVTLRAGETTNIVLGPGAATLSGRLMDHAGNPIVPPRPNELYLLCSPFARTLDYGAPIDLDGSFVLQGLDPGTFRIVANRTGGWPVEQIVEVAAPATSVDLIAPAHRIVGRVAGEIPAPPDPNWPHHVTVKRQGGPYWPQAMVRVDQHGNFEVPYVPAGTYSLVLEFWEWKAPQYRTATATVRDADEVVEVVLRKPENTGWIMGNIVPTAGGVLPNPERTSIQALRGGHDGYSLDRTYMGCWSAPGRSYRFEELPEGDYTVWVQSRFDNIPLACVAKVAVKPNQAARVDLSIRPGRRVRILPGFRDQRAVVRFSWQLRVENGWLSSDALVGADSMSLSASSLPVSLPFGDYTLEARFGDGAPVQTTFAVIPGDGVQTVTVSAP